VGVSLKSGAVLTTTTPSPHVGRVGWGVEERSLLDRDDRARRPRHPGGGRLLPRADRPRPGHARPLRGHGPRGRLRVVRPHIRGDWDGEGAGRGGDPPALAAGWRALRGRQRLLALRRAVRGRDVRSRARRLHRRGRVSRGIRRPGGGRDTLHRRGGRAHAARPGQAPPLRPGEGILPGGGDRPATREPADPERRQRGPRAARGHWPFPRGPDVSAAPDRPGPAAAPRAWRGRPRAGPALRPAGRPTRGPDAAGAAGRGGAGPCLLLVAGQRP
jgi:hypothetical protein